MLLFFCYRNVINKLDTPEQIRDFRIDKRMSIRQMADKLGISPQLLGQYENGKRRPKTNFYLKFNEVFGVNLLETNASNRFEEATAEYIKKGHNPTIPILSTDQGNVLLMSINAASYAAIEMLCRVVSNQENIPIEQVRAQANQLTHERQRLVEQVLDRLVSVVPSDNTKKTDSN